MLTHKLTAEIINAAVEGFEQQKLRIDAQIAELRAMLTGTPTEPAATPEAPKGKRRMSAAARKRISDAQRKRWAAKKAAGKTAAKTQQAPAAKKATAKKAPVKASRKAAKKAAAKRPQKTAATPAVPVATA